VQGGAVLGQQGLVGGHHALARPQGGQDVGAGRLDAADDLHDQVDVVAGDQRGGVRGEQLRVDGQVAHPAEPTDGDPGQLQRGAHPGGQVVAGGAQQADHLGPDGAAAQQRDPQRRGHQITSTGSCCVAVQQVQVRPPAAAARSRARD
jgi:hypothetical protein